MECGSFAPEKSTFTISKGKAGTGRVVGWGDCRIASCWTLEASFAGDSPSHGRGEHYHAHGLEAIGASLGESFARWRREVESN